MGRYIALGTAAVAVAGLVIASGPAAGARTIPKPSVTAISPAVGPTTGGTRVTIAGSHFSGVVSVLFGTTRGTSVRVRSSTSLAVTAPRHALGGVDVRVIASGGRSALTAKDRFSYLKPLVIGGAALPPGIAGVAYSHALTATGGQGPYTWSAAHLPAGLALTRAGVLSGRPETTGTAHPAITVTDARLERRTELVTLTVPNAVPSQCLDGACVSLTPDAGTVQVPAGRVVTITYNAKDVPTSVVLNGPAPQAGQRLVIAATSQDPSGLIVKVGSVAANSDGSSTLAVTQLAPSDAFSSGIVEGTGAAATVDLAATSSQGALAAAAAAARRLDRPITIPPAIANGLVSCSTPNITSSVRHLSIQPKLVPTVSIAWGGKLFSKGSGLKLFEVGIQGGLDINIDMSVSASATCKLNLPSFRTTIPAGELGVIVLELVPTVTFKVTGTIGLTTSASLDCGADYRWFEGAVTRTSFCSNTSAPLQLSQDTGIDATLTAEIEADASIDGVLGISGNVTGVLHGGYHPRQHPVAELDAKVAWSLQACVVCIVGNGGLLKVTIASGTLFNGVLVSYDKNPPVFDPGPPGIATTSLPAATKGSPYTATLQSGDGRAGTWSITQGHPPAGLSLAGATITGTPTTAETSTFQLTFTDSKSRTAQEWLSVQVRDISGLKLVVRLTTVTPNPVTAGGTVTLAAKVTGPSAELVPGDSVNFCFADNVFNGFCGPEQPNTLATTFLTSADTASATTFLPNPGTYQVYAAYIGPTGEIHSATVQLVVTAPPG